jgi:DNA-directed RNA polymerase specialized sigma24 family protein
MQERVLAQETRGGVQNAIEALAIAEREVITLRDLEGRSAAEVCNTPGLRD